VINHRWIITKENIWIFAVLRVSALPLIVCCIKGWIFAHDFWSILFVSSLGFTNGYLGSLAIIMVGEWVDFKDKGLTGTFVSHEAFLPFSCLLGFVCLSFFTLLLLLTSTLALCWWL
jgi:hypothetical protein